jgi:rhodanese-related sulfurtransferase
VPTDPGTVKAFGINYRLMKLPLLIASVALAVTINTAGQVTDSVKFTALSPYYFHLTWLTEDPVLLADVREYREYRRNRLQNAVSIPELPDLEAVVDTMDKEMTIMLYCDDNSRSIWVAEYLYDRGYRRIYYLNGGVREWKKEGYPLDKKRIRRR